MASNRRWRLQFRCRGSRHESAVAQLFSLGGYTFMKTTHSIQPSGFRLFMLSTPLLALVLGIVVESIYFFMSTNSGGVVHGVLGDSFLWIHWPALKVTQHICDWIRSGHTPVSLIFFSFCLIECELSHDRRN